MDGLHGHAHSIGHFAFPIPFSRRTIILYFNHRHRHGSNHAHGLPSRIQVIVRAGTSLIATPAAPLDAVSCTVRRLRPHEGRDAEDAEEPPAADFWRCG